MPEKLTLTYISRDQVTTAQVGDYTLEVENMGDIIHTEQVTISGTGDGFKIPINVTLDNPDTETVIRLNDPDSDGWNDAIFMAAFRPYQAMKEQQTVMELFYEDFISPAVNVGISPQY
jgi:hypothetical protein